MYSHLTEVNNYSEICLEIKFICLNKGIIKIFSENFNKNHLILFGINTFNNIWFNFFTTICNDTIICI